MLVCLTPHLPGPGPGLGVPVSSRVSTKIQQLLNTLKRPKRPPLSEFFLDDQEEIVEGVWLRVHNKHTVILTVTRTQMFICFIIVLQSPGQILTPRGQRVVR